MTMRGHSLTIATAAALTAACCLLFIPRVRAFLSAPLATRRPPPISRLSETSRERQPDGMPILPPDVVKYTQVPKEGTFFTATKIPSGLLKEHTTKKGTWGVIRVSQGKLEYAISQPSESVHVLDGDRVGIIEPTMLHRVKALSDDLQFAVEFWRVPGTGVVDEKREGL